MIVIVDDDDVVRSGLLWLCESRRLKAAGYEDGIVVLDALESGDIRLDEPLCLLLDVRMPRLSGIELFETLIERHMCPPASVCFLTGHGDIPMAVEMVKRGAFDFFEKPSSDNQLVDRLVEGEQRSADYLRQAREGAARSTAFAERAGLSPREIEVMAEIVRGKRNKIIAADLGISIRTVELHRARVFSKFGVRSAVELARLVSRQDEGVH